MKSKKTKIHFKLQETEFNIPYDILASYAENEVSYCTVCKQWKPLGEFQAVSADDKRPRSYCKYCNKTAWPCHKRKLSAKL